MLDNFKGGVISPEHSEYDEARVSWNAMYDRYPAMIAKCQDKHDVVAAIQHAQANDIEVAVRCGGHSVPGHSVIDNSLVIDLSEMNAVDVDADSRTVRFQGGCLLGTVDEACQEHGLATTAGAVSHTGAGGLIPGGGVGWLMSKHGLSVDNLLGVEVVTAKGEIIKANADENPDLFWAVRGGGGNFGVITEFTMQLHERGPVQVSFTILPYSSAKNALSRWREVVPTAPDDFIWQCFVRPLPAYPFVPQDKVGDLVLVMPIAWLGDHAEGDRVIDQYLQEFAGEAIVQEKMLLPYAELQKIGDELGRHGNENYSKSGFIAELPDEIIDQLLEQTTQIRSELSVIEFVTVGGAVSRVPVDETAFPHRDAQWLINILGVWEPHEEAAPNIEWVRECFELIKPHLVGAYYNFGGSEEEGERDVFGSSERRLREIKTKYDPENFFHNNANIKPLSE